MSSLPSPAFLEYNEGKVEVRDGLVYLLPQGWAEYGKLFAQAGRVLRDGTALQDFCAQVRELSLLELDAGEAAGRAMLGELSRDAGEKVVLRHALDGAPVARAQTAELFKLKKPG